jgi:hypothetical protein
VGLSEGNFMPALQASCSIPFALKAVQDIPGAPSGAYWDGGITDYHLHLNWTAPATGSDRAIVLYPHFQQSVVPGWLDKALKWRHGATSFLDSMVLLAPNPQWIKTLPGGKLPDDLLSFDEWQRHKRFDDYGRKIEIEDPEKTTEKFIAKLTEIRNRLKEYGRQGVACPTCHQPLPDGWPNQSMAVLVASGLVGPNELFDD